MEINKIHDRLRNKQPPRCQIRKKPTTPSGTSGWRTSTNRNWKSKSAVHNHLPQSTQYLSLQPLPLLHPDLRLSHHFIDQPQKLSRLIRLPLLRPAHLDPSQLTRPLHSNHTNHRHLHKTSLPRQRRLSRKIQKGNLPRKTTTTNHRRHTAKAIAHSNPLHI